MNIKDVEKLTGLSRPNIRYYEEEKLISPQRGENNYRVYSEEDVRVINDIKKLRLLGVPIHSIRAYLEGSVTLAALMTSRLEEIDSDTGILSKQAEICRAAIDNKAKQISDISLDERQETWQRRLAILMRDDIVNHKLSRTEFNRDVLLAYLAGCAVAVITGIVLLLTGAGSRLDDPVILFVLFAGIIITGIAPMWTGSMRVHSVALVLSAALNTSVIWTLLLNGIQGNIPGTGMLNFELHAGTGLAARVTFIIYIGLAVLAVIAWTLSQLVPKAFSSVIVAASASLIYTGCVLGLAGLICARSMPAGFLVMIVIIAFVVSMSLTISWSDINRERTAFTRYSAMLTAFKMSNVVFNLISGRGYYGATNVRRG